MSAVGDLYDAIEAGDADSIERLLDDTPELVEGAGATPPPVHWAIYHDQPLAVRSLVARGANLERRDQDRDSTPLAYSIVFGRQEIAEWLLHQGANRDGMYDLARRGAAGEFENYPDVASREQFEQLAVLLRGS